MGLAALLWSVYQVYTRLYKIYIEEVNKSNINLLPVFLQELLRVDRLTPEAFSRNDQWYRNHIANLVCLLTFSTKNKLPKFPKLRSMNETCRTIKTVYLRPVCGTCSPFIKKIRMQSSCQCLKFY